MIACQNGHTGIVELLLDSGAVVNLRSNNGIGPLYKASKNGYESIVQRLLPKGANVNYMYKRRIQRRSTACQNENGNRRMLMLMNDNKINSFKKLFTTL